MHYKVVVSRVEVDQSPTFTVLLNLGVTAIFRIHKTSKDEMTNCLSNDN